jgi:F420-dependent oxidoreductase-like protein
MRICLMVEGQEGVSWDQWRALAVACEQARLDGLFRSDHYLSVVGLRERASLDAWTTLAGLAAATERIRLGALVSPVTFRHPSVLAKSVATVDHVSGGRVELGLGAGWNQEEHAAYGFDFPDLPVRMELLEEQMEIVHRLWTEESVTFAGRHYRLQDCPGLPKPVQKPHPPLIVGGHGGRRSVALAVASVDDCRQLRTRLSEACERAGRDPGGLRLSLMATTIVGADRSDVLDRVRRVLAVWGAEDEDPEEVLSERQEHWVVGMPAEVVSRLRELERAGVERVYLQHLLHEDVEAVALLGAEVAPEVS